MTIKKIILFLLAATFSIVGRAANGDTLTYDGLTYRITSEADHTAEVAQNSASGYVKIAPYITYDGERYDVTAIGARAFLSCRNIKTVDIPNSVILIGESAFADCSGMTSITIPESVTQIDYDAFFGCDSLTEVTIPNSVTTLDDCVFFECQGLTTINIGSSVNSLSPSIVYYCSNLKEINVDADNDYYSSEDGVVYSKDKSTLIICPAAKTEMAIHASVTKIGDYAFYFGSLRTIDIPNSVVEIGDAAFCNCRDLTMLTIPASMTTIGEGVFGGCLSLKSVDIGNSLTEINNSVFSQCSSLTNIVIPNSVKKIGEKAFYNCTSLRSIDIPNSVTMIGESAFSGCSSLKSVDISNSATMIGESAFYSCTSLESVDIPDTVTVIGESAFSGCISLQSATLSKSLTTLPFELFSDCINLSSITIPDSVTYIGSSVFSNCTNLKSVFIGKSVDFIWANPFLGCYNLTNIEVDPANEYFCSENGVVYSFDKTTLVVFAGDKTEFNIPDGVTTIAKFAFSRSRISKLSIPNSMTTICEYAFSRCTDLVSIVIPDSVARIYWGAFNNCSSLTSITIGRSMAYFDKNVFAGCSNLTKIINLNPTPPRCLFNALTDIPTDATFYIPKGSLEAYQSADEWSRFSNFHEMGSIDIAFSCTDIELEQGKSAIIGVTVTKDDDVAVDYGYWLSSNPEVATVQNGIVTAVNNGIAEISYTTTDEYGVTRTASCTVTVANGTSSIAGVDFDESENVDIFSIHGVAVYRNVPANCLKTLSPGIYIVRQGSLTKKVNL